MQDPPNDPSPVVVCGHSTTTKTIRIRLEKRRRLCVETAITLSSLQSMCWQRTSAPYPTPWSSPRWRKNRLFAETYGLTSAALMHTSNTGVLANIGYYGDHANVFISVNPAVSAFSQCNPAACCNSCCFRVVRSVPLFEILARQIF